MQWFRHMFHRLLEVAGDLLTRRWTDIVSRALVEWRTDGRIEIDSARAHAAFAGRGTPRQVVAADVELASYVLTLCAEFQHFCDRLYIEAVALLEAHVGAMGHLQIAKLLRVNVTQARALQRGNTSHDNLVVDFSRLGASLKVSVVGQRVPSYPADKLALDELLRHRNALIHGNARVRDLGVGDPVRTLDLPAADDWLAAVDRLAGTLDSELASALTPALGVAPW